MVEDLQDDVVNLSVNLASANQNIAVLEIEKSDLETQLASAATKTMRMRSNEIAQLESTIDSNQLHLNENISMAASLQRRVGRCTYIFQSNHADFSFRVSVGKRQSDSRSTRCDDVPVLTHHCLDVGYVQFRYVIGHCRIELLAILSEYRGIEPKLDNGDAIVVCCRRGCMTMKWIQSTSTIVL